MELTEEMLTSKDTIIYNIFKYESSANPENSITKFIKVNIIIGPINYTSELMQVGSTQYHFCGVSAR